MVTDYYRQVYSQKINHHGGSLQDKAVGRGIQEFKRYLATTPTAHDITRLHPPSFAEGDQIRASITGPSSKNLVADRMEQNLMGDLDDGWVIGDIFTWNEEHWIVISQERLTIPTHFKGKIRFCNHYLKWNIGNQIYQVPGHVITSRAFALEEGQKSGIIWDELAMVIQAIIPSNEVTRTIKRYQRFIIKGRAWQVVSTDQVSVDNLLFVRLEEDQINRATDDIDNEIADRYVPSPTTEEITEAHEYRIDGPHKMYWNGTGEFTAYLDQGIDNVQSFALSDIELASIESEANGNPVIIRANSKGYTGNVVLTCTFSDDFTLEKIIQIVSLWGD